MSINSWEILYKYKLFHTGSPDGSFLSVLQDTLMNIMVKGKGNSGFLMLTMK